MNTTNRAASVAAGQLPRLATVCLTALLLLGVALQARGQTANEADPPSRVARLSEANGQVWLYSPDVNEWVGVARNRPLTTGDRIATDNGARAEITLGSTTLRLDAATELEILQLDDSEFRLQLHGGSVAARFRSPQALSEFALETDEGRFRVQTVGRYRFDRFDQASDLTVFAGQAAFEGRNSALPLTTGQHGQFWLDAAGAAQYRMAELSRDDFFGYVEERDRAENRVAANRYVSPEMTGAQDLDRHGRWEQTAEYGAIWTPRGVAPDWAPYSTGHWAWVRPWGWTWVDDAPWGFAPFHYGRWVYHRNAWGWAPGTYVARPVYAPALVAWIGGPRVSVSINLGGGPPVGWFPLAPREVYVPSYRSSYGYWRNVNVTHVTNVTQITNVYNRRRDEDRRDFANRKFPHAVTVVPASVLTGRQPVAPEAARLRADPRMRAIVADARPAPAMTTAPVAAPPERARSAESRAPARPPFQGRPDRADRPDRPDRPGSAGQPPIAAPNPGATPAVPATPTTGGTAARPGMPPQAGVPPPGGALPQAGLPPQPGAPAQAGQPPRAGAPAQAGVSPQAGVPAQAGMPPRAGAPAQAGVSPQAGVPAPPQAGVPAPAAVPPQAGLPPRAGGVPAQAATPPRAGGPPQAGVPAQGGVSPQAGGQPAPRESAAAPPLAGSPRPADPGAIARPPLRGGVMREPAEGAPGRSAIPPSLVQRSTQPGDPSRPVFTPREPGQGRPLVTVVPPPGSESARMQAPAARPGEPPRVRERPAEPARAAAPPAAAVQPAVAAPAAAPPRAAAPPAAAVQPAVAAPAAAPPRAQPETRTAKPEPPRPRDDDDRGGKRSQTEKSK